MSDLAVPEDAELIPPEPQARLCELDARKTLDDDLLSSGVHNTKPRPAVVKLQWLLPSLPGTSHLIVHLLAVTVDTHQTDSLSYLIKLFSKNT